MSRDTRPSYALFIILIAREYYIILHSVPGVFGFANIFVLCTFYRYHLLYISIYPLSYYLQYIDIINRIRPARGIIEPQLGRFFTCVGLAICNKPSTGGSYVCKRFSKSDVIRSAKVWDRNWPTRVLKCLSFMRYVSVSDSLCPVS